MAKPVSGALTRVVEPTDIATTFERMAKDPTVDVTKFERLIALMERGEARKAETAFNAAMSAAQREMRPVAADAFNPSTRSKYASYEAIHSALRPIYTAHGFGLSFNTAPAASPDHVVILCLVTHEMGHSREYQVDMPADGKGARGSDVMTKTHAVGSAVSYGMRYLLKMIFNVAIGEDDDDGVRAGAKAIPAAKEPEGFELWWHDLQAVADQGSDKLAETWVKSNRVFKQYLVETNNAGWVELKKKADAKMRPAPREVE
jgi:hypothetical protein